MEILAQVLRVDADMGLCLWSSIINIDPDSSWVLYRCGDVSVLQMTFSPTPIQSPKTLGSCALPTCSSRPLTNQVWTLLPQATGDQEIWGLWTCLLECKSSFTCKFKKKKKKNSVAVCHSYRGWISEWLCPAPAGFTALALAWWPSCLFRVSPQTLSLLLLKYKVEKWK